MKVLLGVFAASLMLVAWINVSAQGKPSDSPVDRLKSTKFQTREEAKQGIVEKRKKTINQLMDIVKTGAKVRKKEKPDPEEFLLYLYATSDAMDMLGKLRATESVGLLTDNIFLSRDPIFGGQNSKIENFPAAIALTEIGKPGSLAALKRLEGNISEIERGLYCYVIDKVEGEHAKLIIDARISSATDEKVRANLKAALPVLEKVHRTGRIR